MSVSVAWTDIHCGHFTFKRLVRMLKLAPKVIAVVAFKVAKDVGSMRAPETVCGRNIHAPTDRQRLE